MSLAAQWNAAGDFYQKHIMAPDLKAEALAKAVENNDAAAAKRLLKNGADPSPSSSFAGRNALLTAIKAGNKEMLQLLIENKADMRSTSDYGATTPLLAAIETGKLDIVTMVIDAGAGLNTSTYKGYSPLSSAINAGKNDIVDLLIDKGADINNASRGGWTPLFHAVAAGNAPLVQKLLDKGARTDRRDENGRSVLAIAKACEQTGIYDMIQSHIDAQVKPWQLLEDDKIAHVSIMRGLGYKLTEVFNLATQQYTAITHNYATNADSAQTRALDAAADKTIIAEAAAQLNALKPKAQPQAQPGA